MRLKILITTCLLLFARMLFAADFECDTIKSKNGNDIVITFIKHGSLLITYEKQHIQIDPVSAYADYSQFTDADIIIITHEHADHLDAQAIAELEKAGTILITNQRVYDILGKGIVMKNGDVFNPMDYVTIEAVPAYNITPGREQYHPRYRDNGFIFTIDGTRIYVAGDTEDIPEMKKLERIDVAFLPVNQPYTMTVEQAVNAVNMFHPAIMYPYHYSDTPVEKIAELLQGSTTEVRIRQMQ